ncbi:MAG TPA: ABC transporter ATP-binding protein [Spirochaetota bacterium]|jgi:ATP-binding cassette subfamily B protein|nr:ABC transporter ATP-binding protein [Spirochaetota bacterium]HPJ13703.1 ABC transporter ATP-binding protein [Spirochaetota bacterium]
MIKTIALITKNNKLRIIQTALISTIEAVFGFTPLIILYFLLCSMIDGTFTYNKLTLYSIILGIGTIFRGSFSYLNVTVSRRNGTLLIKDLRLRIGEHIRKLSMGFFDSHDVGELSMKVLDNINKMEMILTMLFPEIISAFAMSILVAGSLFFIEPRMAFATIITMPIALYIMTWAKNIMINRGRELYKSSFRLADSLLEFLNGIKYIKSFSNSQKKLNDLIETMDDFRKNSLKTEGTLSPVMVLAGIFIDIGIVSVVLMGSYLLIGGSISPKIFIIFIIISSRFFDILKSLSVNYIKVKYLGIAGKSVNEILELKETEGTDLPVFSNRDIRFKNVSFAYNGTNVLNKINLDIKENTMTAFVGPSGSGKTTLANLICRFYDPQSGTILMDGRDIRKIDPEHILRQTSSVFQKVFLFNYTIFNNIKIGHPGASENEVIDAAKKSNAHDFIMKLPDAYNTMVGENAVNLSGGEQQRISIARAILKNAPIVILDEATASLDPENELFIQHAISNLLKNKTIIVIAHRLKTIKNADKIVLLNRGKIEAEGSHEFLLNNSELYQSMWDKQNSATGWIIGN